MNGRRGKDGLEPEGQFPPRVELALRVRRQEGQQHDVEAGGDVEVAIKI